MFVAGFYALYFGGIFDAAATHHAAHVLMNLHFLMSEYLFYWVVIGIDPPRDGSADPNSAWSSPRCRCAFFAVVLMGMATVLGDVLPIAQLPWHGPSRRSASRRLDRTGGRRYRWLS